MLRKNIFKLICFILVLLAGCIFTFKENAVSAELIIPSNKMVMLNMIESQYDDLSADAKDVSSISKYSLRDDYVIYTNNQTDYGLCWAYAGSMALSTTLMLATGEYFDISEAWVSFAFNYVFNDSEYMALLSQIFSGDYTIGEGGWFYSYDLLINDEKQEKLMSLIKNFGINVNVEPFYQGIVLESDFNTSDLASLCDENVNDLYDYYSECANKEIMENVISGRFGNYTDSSFSGNKKSMINAIKSHIKNRGAVAAEMDWALNGATTTTSNYTYKIKDRYDYYLSQYGSSNVKNYMGGHAISLIGWDDNITINGEKGAWIALNSYGDSWGDGGEFYISYNDTDFTGFYGYKYSANTTEELYFSNKIVKADDAVYYEDYQTKTGEKDNKNIFYNNQADDINYNITYAYSTNANENKLDVNIFHFEKDVTDSFEYAISDELNQISISPKSEILNNGKLPVGTYKVITNYESVDGQIQKEYLNVFYIMDGLELEEVSIRFAGISNSSIVVNEDMGNIKNNGRTHIYNNYNHISNDIYIASTHTEGEIVVDLIKSIYNDIASINVSPNAKITTSYSDDNNNVTKVIVLEFNSTKRDYIITLTNGNNENRTINVHILKASTSDIFADFKYDTNGGLNNVKNKERMLVGNSGIKLYAPTKTGYIFKGWYTDEDFVSGSALTQTKVSGVDVWSLSKEKVNTETSPTRYSNLSRTDNYNDKYFASCSYVELYAKWEKEPVYYTVEFYSRGGSLVNKITNAEEGKTIAKPTDPIKTGFKFVGWYTSENFEENSKWDFATNIITGDLELYAKWELVIPEFEVKFYNGIDEEPITSIYKQGTRITKPEDPAREGYEFIGWFTAEDEVWDFNTQITQNVSLYAKYEINKYTVVFHGDGNITSNETISNVEHGTKINMPSTGNKKGYELDGWYTTSSFETGSKWDFTNNVVTKNIDLYPRWTLSNLLDVDLVISAVESQTYTNFNVSVKFSHKIQSEPEVLLYKKLGEDSTFELVTSLLPTKSITQDGNDNYNFVYKYVENVSESGIYYYYATINYFVNGTNLTATTQPKSIKITPKQVGIYNILYEGEGQFTWEDDDIGGSYIVKLIDDNANEVINSWPKTENKLVNVWSNITLAGQYSIIIEKYIGNIKIGEITSEAFSVVAVNYDSIFATAVVFAPQLIDKQSKAIEPMEPNYDGYEFKGWYSSESYEENTKWDFVNNTISKNITLYALWEIVEEISFEKIKDITTVYDKNMQYTITANANHSFAVKYSFTWYKLVNGKKEEVINNANLTVSKVKDSGTYFYETIIIDKKGFIKVSNSPEMEIVITKAKTTINFASVTKVYEYDATIEKREINYGARITRDDESVEVEYVNDETVGIYDNGEYKEVYVTNWFTDVPEGGKKIIYLRAPETDNYEMANVWFYIYVNKAKSYLTVNDDQKNQVYTYNGKIIVPEFTLNNTQQTDIEYSVTIKDVGNYENVVITAKESQNYLSSYEIINVVVKPAKIKLQAKDVYSIWLFDIKDYDNIDPPIGDYYGDDLNIKVECLANKNKLGKFEIKITANNPNYDIEIINGTYTVTGLPYFAAIFVLLVIIAVLIVLHKKKLFMVEFIENGGSIVKPIDTNKKAEVNISSPTKDGFKFGGWYLDESCTIPFKNKLKRGKQLILYAKWVETDDYKAYEDEHDQVRQILKELNIIKPEEKVEIKEEIIPTVVEEKPREKTEEEKMKDLISGVKISGTKASDDDIDDLISFVTHKEYVRPNNKKQEEEQKPKSQEELLNELLERASKTPSNASQEDIDKIINNINNK